MNHTHEPPPTPASADGKAAAFDWRALWRRIGPAGPLALIASTLPAVGGFLLLSQLERFGPWLAGHDGMGVTFYVVGFAVLAGLALLPTYAQAVLGGWAFGSVLGFAAAMAGFGGAALVGFGVARRASGDRVVDVIESNAKWKAVYRALVRSGFWRTLLIVTLVRLPSSPFALTNLVMAATRVSLPAYILGTLLGMAPRTLAAVVIGAHLSTLDFGQARNLWLMGVGVAGILVVLAIIGQIANNALARVTAERE